MAAQERQLDFEDFSSDSEKLSAILKRCEVSAQKHKLAYEWYRARKFLLLVPGITSSVAIGVIGFLVTTEAIKRHMKVGDVQVEDVLTIIVGCLGFFVGTMMLLGNQFDFGARERMHLSAMIDLEALGDKVRFWKVDRKLGSGKIGSEAGSEAGDRDMSGIAQERKALGVVETPNSHKVALIVASGKALKKVEDQIQQKTTAAKKTEESRSDVSRFSGYNGAYHQVLRGCKSIIPIGINRPFDLFESRLECMSLGHLGVVWDTRMRRNQIMRLAAVEIYNEISGYWLWPFHTPDIDHVIDRSMKRVARLVSRDYRAPVKVQCCGFTIFRCCCRKKNPKSSLLHSIFDGIEDREEEVMGARQVTDYIYTGERNDNGEYLIEEDAYAAEQKLRYLENGEYDASFSRLEREYVRDEHAMEADAYMRNAGKYPPRSRDHTIRDNRSMDSRSHAEYSVPHDSLTASGASVQWEDASDSEYGSVLR